MGLVGILEDVGWTVEFLMIAGGVVALGVVGYFVYTLIRKTGL